MSAEIRGIVPDTEHLLAVALFHAMNGDPSMLERLRDQFLDSRGDTHRQLNLNLTASSK